MNTMVHPIGHKSRQVFWSIYPNGTFYDFEIQKHLENHTLAYTDNVYIERAQVEIRMREILQQ